MCHLRRRDSDTMIITRPGGSISSYLYFSLDYSAEIQSKNCILEPHPCFSFSWKRLLCWYRIALDKLNYEFKFQFKSHLWYAFTRQATIFSSCHVQCGDINMYVIIENCCKHYNKIIYVKCSEHSEDAILRLLLFLHRYLLISCPNTK